MPKGKKVDNFFALWACIMEASGQTAADDDPLGELLDRMFQKEYKDGRESTDWVKKELNKAKNPETLGIAIDSLISKNQYFYLAAGFALGGLYDVMEPKARTQIDYLRKRIHDGGIFPMPAKLVDRDEKEKGTFGKNDETS